MATSTKVTDNAGLLATGLYSDMTIVCGERQFKVHKAIVCVKSPVMATQMSGPWKESKENVVHIEEFSAATVERMLNYLYVGCYESRVIESDTDIPKHWCQSNRMALLHAKMVAIADYYQVKGLKPYAATFFRDWAAPIPPSGAGIIDIAQAVWMLLPPDDRTLKDLISRILDKHKLGLYRDPNFMTALERGGGIVSEFLSLFVKANESEVRMQKNAQLRCTELKAELERTKMGSQQQIAKQIAKTAAAELKCRELEATKLNQQSQIRTLTASIVELRDKLVKAEVSARSSGSA